MSNTRSQRRYLFILNNLSIIPKIHVLLKKLDVEPRNILLDHDVGAKDGAGEILRKLTLQGEVSARGPLLPPFDCGTILFKGPGP